MTKPNFAAALARTLVWEGGYSNDANDPGGETYAGISRVYWPDWPGWARVDTIRSANTEGPVALNKALAASAAVESAVADFYREHFWNPLQADSWNDGDLAANVFDAAVNMGFQTAALLLQQALGFDTANQDGIIGPKTIQALNAAGPALLPRFAALRALRYARIARVDQKESEYLLGWLQRALATLLGR